MKYQLTYQCDDVEFMTRLHTEILKLAHAMEETTRDAAKKRSAQMVIASGRLERVHA
jgi:hypothetical protein